jgi:hypothetical protein
MQRKQTFLIMMMALSVVSCGKTPVSQSSESTSNSNSESSSSSSSESLSSSSSEDVYEPRDVYASPKGTPTAKGTEDDPYNLTEAIKQSTPFWRGTRFIFWRGLTSNMTPLKGYARANFVLPSQIQRVKRAYQIGSPEVYCVTTHNHKNIIISLIGNSPAYSHGKII